MEKVQTTRKPTKRENGKLCKGYLQAIYRSGYFN